MSFDFDEVFDAAVDEALAVIEGGSKSAKEWVNEVADANRETLRAIGEGVLKKQISKSTATMLLRENERALQSEAAALSVLIKATAQAAINAFLDSLYTAFSSALKISI